MPACTLKNCSQSMIGVIVFNPADVIRGVDAGQFLIQPGQSQKLETNVIGTHFTIGIVYDTYYRWNDPKFNCYWGSTADYYGLRGNWMRYRLFTIEQDELDTTLCLNRAGYTSQNGEGIVLTDQNGSAIEAEPFSDQHYREVSLGFLLSMLAPLMGVKQEGQVLFDGAMVAARVMSDRNVTIKDAGLLTCGLLRLYHLQQAKGGFEGMAKRAEQTAKERGPEMGQKLGEKGHQAANKIEQKGHEFSDSHEGHRQASQAGQKGHEMAEKAKEQGQRAPHDIEDMKQTVKETGQMISDAAREFLRSVGMEDFLDQVKQGDLNARDVKAILQQVLKMAGKSDFELTILRGYLGMEEEEVLNNWWKGTQGNVKQRGSARGQQSGNALHTNIASHPGIGSNSNNLMGSNTNTSGGIGNLGNSKWNNNQSNASQSGASNILTEQGKKEQSLGSNSATGGHPLGTTGSKHQTHVDISNQENIANKSK